MNTDKMLTDPYKCHLSRSAPNALQCPVEMVKCLLVMSVLLIGCSKKPAMEPTIESKVVSGFAVEEWSYGNRHYLIFEDKPSVTADNFIRSGYVSIPVTQRPTHKFKNYPGHFGIGIDKSDTTEVFHKNSSWIIITDYSLTAEIFGSTKDTLRDLETLIGEVNQPSGDGALDK